MPGLIDLHVHTIAIELNLAQQVHIPNVLVTLRSTLLLRGMLRRGFTTVRDAGGAGHAMKQAIETGLTDGPRLFVSGRALSQTGGHGDMRARSDYLASDATCPCCVRVGALARVADGVDGVRKAVREELQMGADQIKIMASGGVASPPIRSAPSATPRTRSAPSSTRRRAGRPTCSHMPIPQRRSRARFAAAYAPSSTAISSTSRPRA